MPPKIGGITEIVCREEERKTDRDRKIDPSRTRHPNRRAEADRYNQRQQDNDDDGRDHKGGRQVRDSSQSDAPVVAGGVGPGNPYPFLHAAGINAPGYNVSRAARSYPRR